MNSRKEREGIYPQMLDSPCLASQVISDAQEMSGVVKGTLHTCMASLVAQRLKRLPAMQETWV